MTDIVLSAAQLATIRDVLAPFAASIERVGVFGSRATGTARPNSDIDLVLYGPLNEASMDRIWTRFDESDLAVPVDVVVYDLLAFEPMKRHIDAVARTILTRVDLEQAA